MKKPIGILALSMVAMAAAATTNLVVSEDAYIDSSTADTNYGAAADLTVQMGAVIKMVYIKFDASSLGEITDISSIQAYWYDLAYDRGATVYLITNSSYMAWSENSITWNNAPGNETTTQYLKSDAGILLGAFNVPSPVAAGTIELVWTDTSAKNTLMNLMNNNKSATLVLVRPTDRYAKFASKEATDGAHPIRMVVEADAAAPRKLSLFVLQSL